MPSLNPISHVTAVEPLQTATKPEAAAGDFSSVLASAVKGVESRGAEAKQLVESFLAGESVDLHTAAIASQKASLQFDLFLQMRNKVVSAYQEIMRIQL